MDPIILNKIYALYYITKEFNFGANVYKDIKNINLAEHKPEETGYEFVKYIQDFDYNKLDLEHNMHIAADMVQEGY